MKSVDIKSLALPEVKIFAFERYGDERGYFSETFREDDFLKIDFLKGFTFPQHNESFSKPNVIRGLHFQWGPPMGKMVRTIFGRMVDMVMDIRKGSPNFGKIILQDMPQGQWIWVPPGFAHGNFFTEETAIQYFCTQNYKPDSEAGISPFSADIDWSLCDTELKKLFESVKANAIISERDKNSLNLAAWSKDARSENFVYGRE